MAVWFNKWFVFLYLPALVLASGYGDSAGYPDTGFLRDVPHPFHVSVIEISHNATGKSLEITCKIFTDDFEKVLSRNYTTKVDLIKPENRDPMDSLVKKYVTSHLIVQAGGKPLSLSYLGFENDKEAAYAYLEATGIAELKKIQLTCTIMYDLFDDQINIFHVHVNGNRKSTKLNYPDSVTSLEF